jgi:tetratricopeptide (TPR) repeat protein
MTVLSIAGVVFSGPNFFSALVRFAVWGILLKYSFAALKNTAGGNLAPPKIDSKTVSDDFGVVFKQLGIFLIMGFAFFKVAQAAGIIIGFAFLCFAILSIPAMVVVLVGTNSLLRAINPMIFVVMACRIGWAYLLMYLFLILLGGAPVVLGKYIIALLPAGLHPFLFSMAENYYTIISYHLMGYVIFQYHEEIGYEVDLDDEAVSYQDEVAGQDTQNETLNRVNMLVKEGNIDDAIFLLRNETRQVTSDISLAERYYDLLKMKQLISDMLHHAKAYLGLLAKANQKNKLCQVYSECASKKPGFAPNASALLKIASCLNESGAPKKAVDAYNRFIKANPKSPLIPKVYFLASNIINDKLKNPRKAASILKGLIKKYPDHEITPHVEKYLSQINVP